MTADKMGYADVVKLVFDAFKQTDECPADDEGCRVLLSFSATAEDSRTEDALGQVIPGAFGSPSLTK